MFRIKRISFIVLVTLYAICNITNAAESSECYNTRGEPRVSSIISSGESLQHKFSTSIYLIKIKMHSITYLLSFTLHFSLRNLKDSYPVASVLVENFLMRCKAFTYFFLLKVFKKKIKLENYQK